MSEVEKISLEMWEYGMKLGRGGVQAKIIDWSHRLQLATEDKRASQLDDDIKRGDTVMFHDAAEGLLQGVVLSKIFGAEPEGTTIGYNVEVVRPHLKELTSRYAVARDRVSLVANLQTSRELQP